MKFRFTATIAALGLLTPALAGCAETYVSATPTPVDYKACLVSSDTGFTDGGLNQMAQYGLLQSEAQYGAGTSSVELKRGAGTAVVASAARKLVSRGCNLVLTVGAKSAAAVIPLANGNPQVRFAVLAASANTATDGSFTGDNLDLIKFDTRAAYLQAGYLAAARSVSGKVGIVGLAGDANAVTDIWYFRQGVFQYNSASGKNVAIIGAERAEPETWNLLPKGADNSLVARMTSEEIAAGADVLLPAGANGLVVCQVAALSKALVIGNDSDWTTQPRYSKVASAVLASVQKPVSAAVVAEVNRAMGGAAATKGVPTVIGYTATLTDEGSVVWGAGISAKLGQLLLDYNAGKLSVVEQ